MRPKKHKRTGSIDLFRALLDQIINMKHELVLLAGKIDWDRIDDEIAPLYSRKRQAGDRDPLHGRAVVAQEHLRAARSGACERWAHYPYFQLFTGEEFFQHAFERSDLSHWRQRLSDRAVVAREPWRTRPARCAAKTSSGSRSVE
ncbi:hypothetical protein ABIB94_009345 [Bradyrhizobium sp. JR7.2]